ncbi:hypothetical protein M8A51_00160 [Schlegelella sp. S2-27]|uniref:Uncharacterized protein n=1 Tax=Caldimonas mangrovi TaxID=2944811 RepID=A0ABT0YIG3_9BURK|nr:hypothetical protein [Caldimonas mangrovi]MCM5677941.1 hypothetical protein [Caldimonas mangrovi]
MIEESADPVASARVDSGVTPGAWRCLPLTPEIRAQMQVCLLNVEMLAGMRLQGNVGRCVERLDRAIDALVDAVSKAGHDHTPTAVDTHPSPTASYRSRGAVLRP